MNVIELIENNISLEIIGNIREDIYIIFVIDYYFYTGD